MEHPDKNKHLHILAIACVENLEFMDDYGFGGLGMDQKRPFGNSAVANDVCELIGLTPKEKEGPFYIFSEEQLQYAATLYSKELTPFLKKFCVEALSKSLKSL